MSLAKPFTTTASSFYDIRLHDDNFNFSEALSYVRNTDFIAWDTQFLEIIGPDASIERIAAFPGEEHVHEAPVYMQETNELLFSDTSALGWLWAIDVDTHEVCMCFLAKTLSYPSRLMTLYADTQDHNYPINMEH